MSTPAADRKAALGELEATRIASHELLDSLSDADLAQPTANPAWTVKEELWHVAYAVGYMSGLIERARTGRQGIRIPVFLRDWLSVQMVRRAARSADRTALAHRYDTGHARFLTSLNRLQDADWAKGVRSFGNAYRPVTTLAHRPAEHFAEHAAEISVRLGRTAGP